eukprot:21889_1
MINQILRNSYRAGSRVCSRHVSSLRRTGSLSAAASVRMSGIITFREYTDNAFRLAQVADAENSRSALGRTSLTVSGTSANSLSEESEDEDDDELISRRRLLELGDPT